MTLTEVKFAGRVPIKVLPHRAIQHDFENWEKCLVDALIDTLKPGQIVYDIGAEQGEFTALIGKIVGGENVHIFEPSSWYWPNIKAVWKGNDLAKPASCWAAFVGDAYRHTGIIGAEGGTYLCKSCWPDQVKGEIFQQDAFANYIEHPFIQVTTLDSYRVEFPKAPEVIQMDVEGCEGLVIKGATELLRLHHPTIFMELHSDTALARHGTNQEAVLDALAALGYKCELLGRDHDDHFICLPT